MGEFADDWANTFEVVEQLRVVHSRIAALQAEETALMTRLYEARRAQQLEVGVGQLYAGESAATEIGVALKMSQRSADNLINIGLDLEHRYPTTARAFAAGRIDLAQVRAIRETLTNVPEDLLTELEPKIAAYAENADPQRVRRTARRWITEADPEGQAKRRKDAEAGRYVSVNAADNGTTVVDAVLPAVGGRTLFEKLREMACTQVCSEDPRTQNQRRADALVALADGTGRLTCQCGREDCPRAPFDAVAPVARKALVQVGVSAETLAGLQDNPALLAGFGAIDADLARQIARYARFQIITDSDTAAPSTAALAADASDTVVSGAAASGAAALDAAASGAAASGAAASGAAVLVAAEKGSGVKELTYRPTARVAARVRALDGICRAPGCQVPAADTDLDHQDRFDHDNPDNGGRTSEHNLGARCRRHHRLKTLADNHRNGWKVDHLPDREVQWTTPTGDSITTTPEGTPFLFPTEPVPPVTAAGVPDAETISPFIDAGPVIDGLMEMMHVYCTPSQRKAYWRTRGRNM
ncbi:HNH endonuclease signature motif containing protein [Nocardia concava]|uniref:HNH endonuclease signature motif containing protein n=1 Tax=Nocardia concava TaxID=257281 RepID=UPI001427BDA3|nr:HNH endonuclease signature motif containing protein [Nocardia concava]